MDVLLHAVKFVYSNKYIGPRTSASYRLVTKLILKACVWLILLQEVTAWASIWLRLIDKLIYQLNRSADTYLSVYYSIDLLLWLSAVIKCIIGWLIRKQINDWSCLMFLSWKGIITENAVDWEDSHVSTYQFLLLVALKGHGYMHDAEGKIGHYNCVWGIIIFTKKKIPTFPP